MSIMFMCSLALLVSGCLESDERPKLDPKDLVQFMGIEGVYRLDAVAKSESPKTQYISVEPLSNNEYQLTIRNVSEKGALEREATRFLAAFIPLPPERGKRSRFLGVLTQQDLMGPKTYFGVLTQGLGQFNFAWVRFKNDSEKVSIAGRFLQNRGLSVESGTFRGVLTSRVLKEVFTAPEFMAATSQELEYALVSLPKEEASKWSKLFKSNLVDDEQIAMMEFLVDLFSVSMMDIIDKFAEVDSAKSQEVNRKLSEFVKMTGEVASWRENNQGKYWWQSVDARFRYRDFQMLLAASREGRQAFVEAQEILSRAEPSSHGGKYEEAIAQLQIACETLSRLQGEEHPTYAECLRRQGTNYEAAGQYDKADRLLRRASAIEEKVLGQEHPAYGFGLISMAVLAEEMGRDQEAKINYERGAKVIGAMLEGPSEKALIVQGMRYLHAVVKAMSYAGEHGHYDEAEQWLRGLVEAVESILPEFEKQRASLPKFGLGDPGVPDDVGKSVVRIQEFLDSRTIRPITVLYANSMDTLADLYTGAGHYAEAESLYQKARDVWKKEFGDQHLGNATGIGKLGSLYGLMGRYQEAERHILAALDIQKSALGTEHAAYASLLMNLGKVLVKSQREGEAGSLFLRSAQSNWGYLVRNFPAMSEGQKRQFVRRNPFDQTDLLLSLVFRNGTARAAQGLESVLLSKQLLFEAARQESRALQEALMAAGPEWYSMWLKREERRRELVTLALQATGQSGNLVRDSRSSTDPTRLLKLAAEIDQLEQRLRQGNPAYALEAQLGQRSVNDLRNVIRKNEGILEYVKYRPYDFAKGVWEKQRYGTFIISGQDEEVVAVDLGEADTTDAVLRQFQTDMREVIHKFKRATPSENQVRKSEAALAEASSKLRTLIWQPLEQHLRGAKRIYVAPDGLLSLIPFEALAHKTKKGEWQYLVEERELVYLNTGRDLGRLALPSARVDTSRNAVLIGNPAFDASPLEIAKNVAGLAEKKDGVAVNGGTPKRSTLGAVKEREIGRRDLPRNWTQVDALEALLKQAQKQLERAGWTVAVRRHNLAFEEAVLDIRAPGILQFATHGYLLDRPKNDANGWDNPLFRSMLLMAGVNHANPEQAIFYRVGQDLVAEAEVEQRGLAPDAQSRVVVGDGVLTAYEVTGMNLQGTELVNLTACETGLGEVTSEGVAGLRQAFLLAGARALTMTMWEVPAEETTRQIEEFYHRWLGEGQSKKAKIRYEAFRQTQLSALVKAREEWGGAGHPFFWAGVVYIGDPGDLPARPPELNIPASALK